MQKAVEIHRSACQPTRTWHIVCLHSLSPACRSLAMAAAGARCRATLWGDAWPVGLWWCPLCSCPHTPVSLLPLFVCVRACVHAGVACGFWPRTPLLFHSWLEEPAGWQMYGGTPDGRTCCRFSDSCGFCQQAGDASEDHLMQKAAEIRPAASRPQKLIRWCSCTPAPGCLASNTTPGVCCCGSHSGRVLPVFGPATHQYACILNFVQKGMHPGISCAIGPCSTQGLEGAGVGWELRQ